MGEDLYQVLGVPPEAPISEITRVYRGLVRQVHPDTHPDDPSAGRRLAEVPNAYRVLADPAQRAQYDRRRRLGVRSAGRRIPVTIGPPGGGYFAAAGDRQGHTRDRRPRRGPDASVEVQIDLSDAIGGVTVTVEGSSPEVLPRQVRLPAWVTDGQRLRVPFAGDAGTGGGPPGDLYLTVRLRPHASFRQEGHDLAVTVPITFAEAVRGGRTPAPSLDGSPLLVQVPPATRSGATIRLAGAGLPAADRGRAGDLLVTLVIDVPTGLSEAGLRLLDSLAAVPPDQRAPQGS